MPARAFIIHGYLGFPEEAWLPWLKGELEKRGYEVSLPLMPAPDRPVVSEWIEFIDNLVGEPDPETAMVAHSLGCVAVIRYLEGLGRAGKSVGKTLIVAGRFPMGMPAGTGDSVDEVLKPWFNLRVDPEFVRAAAGKCTVILSDNDPYIPLEAAQASFEGNLNATMIVEHGKGHFNEDDSVNELPSALNAIISHT